MSEEWPDRLECEDPVSYLILPDAIDANAINASATDGYVASVGENDSGKRAFNDEQAMDLVGAN